MAPGGGTRMPVVTPLEPDEAVEILADAYDGVAALLAGLTEPDYLRPTLCEGWGVMDVLYHMVGDARRGLAALATPAATGPDVDFVSYWKPWRPGASHEDLVRTRAYRLAAAAVTATTGPALLAEVWEETAPATVRLARLAPYPVVATQGHALTVADVAATLATEATVHHLDMITGLPAAPGPAASCLALVRRTLDGLLGEPACLGWDDEAYVLKGTGREPLTDAERTTLGPLAARFPLFG